MCNLSPLSKLIYYLQTEQVNLINLPRALNKLGCDKRKPKLQQLCLQFYVIPVDDSPKVCRQKEILVISHSLKITRVF